MTLNVSLTRQLEELIKTKVSSGMYTSASEVVREALRLLDERDRIAQTRLDFLREEIRKGMDSGPGIPADEVFDKLEKKYTKMAESKKQ
jgi:antitoxin ParD1/3/4